jgi:signal transduction histidine kinase
MVRVMNTRADHGGGVRCLVEQGSGLAGALLAGFGTAAAAGVLVWVSLFGLAWSVLAAGLPFLAVAVWLVRPLTRVERRRVRWVTGRPVAEAYRPLRGSLLTQVRTVLTDSATWRDLAWLPVHYLTGFIGLACLGLLPLGVFGLLAPLIRVLLPASAVPSFGLPVTDMTRAFLVMPLGAATLVIGWWACRVMAPGSARLSAWLLAPGERARLRARVEHLAATRAETVDARASELRRIGRDLHDGAQARLVSLAMSLGMAEDEIGRDSEVARQLVAEARASASVALSELRDLVRGIDPPVLTERGLAGAVEALALASAVPVEVDVQLSQRLPAPLESAMYFIIAEALTNVTKHSDATWAFVRLWREETKLHLLVRDDGHGGADPTHGTGLRGIERRLAAFDGCLTVSSPPGGPTELFAELPCPA